MINPKVIKTKQQYESYLSEVQMLMEKMVKHDSAEGERLELLTILLAEYENRMYPIEAPDPIDAIMFRMEEKKLKQADLVPYFGTKSRVSEVLSKTRPLTVSMIRSLAVGLDIASDTLLGLHSDDNDDPEKSIDWSKFPTKEMATRGWIDNYSGKPKSFVEDQVKEFISLLGGQASSAAFRRTLSGEAYSPTAKYALYAWMTKVSLKARDKKPKLGVYDKECFSSNLLKELAQLSWFEKGPLLAVEFLEKHGIAVVFEPHLKRTKLDGAAFCDVDGTPIIGMTLRQNRLDNFWFTLLHEVAHHWKHVNKNETFVDETEASTEDRREVEANRISREAFIPRIVWKRSDAYISPSRETIDSLSRELKIHPSIIAGRLRFESRDWSQFSDMIGQGEVKALLNSKLMD